MSCHCTSFSTCRTRQQYIICVYFYLKDWMIWFTLCNNIVFDLYAVYNSLHNIKQPSTCWTSLIMFSGLVFPPKISLVSIAIFVFVIIQCLWFLVCFLKHTIVFISYNWSVKYEMKLNSATICSDIYLIHYSIVHLASARHRALFSIHKPISDSVSRLLLKIVQTDCL